MKPRPAKKEKAKAAAAAAETAPVAPAAAAAAASDAKKEPTAGADKPASAAITFVVFFVLREIIAVWATHICAAELLSRRHRCSS